MYSLLIQWNKYPSFYTVCFVANKQQQVFDIILNFSSHLSVLTKHLWLCTCHSKVFENILLYAEFTLKLNESLICSDAGDNMFSEKKAEKKPQSSAPPSSSSGGGGLFDNEEEEDDLFASAAPKKTEEKPKRKGEKWCMNWISLWWIVLYIWTRMISMHKYNTLQVCSISIQSHHHHRNSLFALYHPS